VTPIAEVVGPLAKWGAIAVGSLGALFGLIAWDRKRAEKIGRIEAEGEQHENQAAAEARRAVARRRRWTRERLRKWAERRASK
jgi:hypothetical protein